MDSWLHRERGTKDRGVPRVPTGSNAFITHRLHSSSFSGLPYRILNIRPLWSLWAVRYLVRAGIVAMCRRFCKGETHNRYLDP